MYKNMLFFCCFVSCMQIMAGDDYGDSYDTLADVARLREERCAFSQWAGGEETASRAESVDSYDSITDVAREREEGDK